MFNVLSTFESFLGTVDTEAIMNAVWILLQGMAALFLVMVVLLLIVLIFGKVTKTKNNSDGQ